MLFSGFLFFLVMANKGLLPRYKVLVWFRVEDEVATDGCITEQETLDKIERWIIESGGWPFCNTLPEEVEGNFWQKRLERHQNVVVDPEIQSEELFDRVLSPAAQLFPNGQNDDI